MTHKDYVLIASTLHNAHRIENAADNISADRTCCAAAVRLTAHLLADALQKDNPRFSRDWFLITAGISRNPQ